MTLRYLSPSKILRDRAWEKEFGIDDLQMLAYIHDDSFTVIGQIQAKEIACRFYMVLVAYAKDVTTLFNTDNYPYDGKFTTNVIVNPPFFPAFPFSFKAYSNLAPKVDHCKIILKGYHNDKN